MGSIYDFEPKKTCNQKTGVIRIAYFNVALGAHLYQKANELLACVTAMPAEFQREFLRAFFDDEGCMDFRKNKRRVRGYQKDTSILSLVQELLKRFDIASRITAPNEVVITGKSNLRKFQKEINFSPGVKINGNRSNSIWKKALEKREILRRAIASFKT